MILEATTDKLYDQVAGDLKSRIQRQEFGENGRLPNFKMLSEEYKVSMATIKKAMQLLSDEKLIVSRVGRGTFAVPANGSAFRKRTDQDQVGLLIRDLDGPYFSGIYKGLAQAASLHGKKLIVTVSVDDHQQEASMYKMLTDQAEGLLLTTRRKSLQHISTFEKLNRMKLPFVLLHDVYDTPTCCFDVDNYLGGRLAARHFIDRGVKKFAVIVGETGYRVDDMRLKGYLDELSSAGVSTERDCFILRCSFGTEATAFDEGYKLGMCLDLKAIGFDGIFLFNDLLAMGFQKAILERGYAIPDDIRVIGFDNIDRCSEARVPLTTIDVPRTEIGQKALVKLIDMMNDHHLVVPERILMEPQLIVRKSS